MSISEERRVLTRGFECGKIKTWSGGDAPARERGPEMTAETAETLIAEFVRARPDLLRRDRDAVSEGWDPVAYPLDSLVVQVFADTVDWDEDAVEVACDAVLAELGF